MTTKTAKPIAEKIAGKYFEGLGKRKTAVARVRLYAGKGITVNGKEYTAYFTIRRAQHAVTEPLKLLGLLSDFSVSAKVKGGGPSAQAEAVRHGIARALVKINADYKKRLRRAGFITRDPRMVERKKYGLKKARRAPQWQKR
ncbi:MAG: 30S ribosomal protein S9 [bacterium]|nr:30S ribosomal protein S9 [bacterium]